MKSICLKFLFILFMVCCVVGVAYQIYLKLTFNYETVIVSSSVMEKKAEGVGVIFKDEVVLNSEEYIGVVRNNFCSGARVAAKSEVAKVYVNQEDILKMKNVDVLNKKINSLSEAQSPGSLQDINIKTISKQMNSKYYDLVNNLKNCNLDMVKEKKDEIIMLFSKKQLATNQVADFNNAINMFTSEKSNIEKTISSKPKSIVTPVAGYFVDYLDGYENVCTPEVINDFDIKKLDDICEKCKGNSFKKNVGKVVTNSFLLFKMSLPTKQIYDVKIGANCKIKFEGSGEELDCKLINLDLNWNSEKSIAIFKIDDITEEILSIRAGKAEVIFNTYRGIKVPKTAIRNNDNGDLGVYSLNNIFMKFKKIDILFEDEENVLCASYRDGKPDYLRDFDKIIVQGKDLYDNKPIR